MRHAPWFCVIILVLLAVGAASGQSVIIDRTGSMANQGAVESELQDTLPAAALVFPAIRLVFFRDRVLQTQAVIVHFDINFKSDFGNLVDAAKLRAVQRADPQIRTAFKSTIQSPAEVSNIPAAIRRTADDSNRGLLLTDAENEAPAPKGIVTIKPIFVVLCSAKRDDPTDELAIYERRKQQILLWAPNARVFACFELRKAVVAWISDDLTMTVTKTAR